MNIVNEMNTNEDGEISFNSNHENPIRNSLFYDERLTQYVINLSLLLCMLMSFWQLTRPCHLITYCSLDSLMHCTELRDKQAETGVLVIRYEGNEVVWCNMTSSFNIIH